jgi:hypothetical protein
MTEPGVESGIWVTDDGQIAIPMTTATADNDWGKYGNHPILKLSPDEAITLSDDFRSMATGDPEVVIVHGLAISLEPDDALELADELKSVATPLLTEPN